MLQLLIEAQLGPLSPEHQKRLDASTAEALDRWAKRLAAKVASLDELFG